MCDGGKGNHPTGSRLVLGDGCALQSCCAPGLPSTCLRPVVPRHPDTPSPHRGVSLIKSLLLDTPARVGAPSPLSLGGCGRQRAPSVLPVPPPPRRGHSRLLLRLLASRWEPRGCPTPFSTFPWEPAGDVAVNYFPRVHSSAASTSVLSCAAGRSSSQTACCPARGSGHGCSHYKLERIGRTPWAPLCLSLPLRGRSAPATGLPPTPAHLRGSEGTDTPEQEPGAWSHQHLSGDACVQVLPGKTSSASSSGLQGAGRRGEAGVVGSGRPIQDHTQKECGHVSPGANEMDVSQCCL